MWLIKKIGVRCTLNFERKKMWLIKVLLVKTIKLQEAYRELKQRRRRRQRERHKTMGLISKNNSSARAFYVLYISLPSSAKQQREMTKFKVLWRT